MPDERVLEIRRSLGRTWGPFFGRFGKLLPIQIRTIPVILAGRNAVISSPTATGKTEAVVAPICERVLADPPAPHLQILYVSPTRALVNDLARRLEGPCHELGLSFSVRTGDRPVFKPKRPSRFLVTTPESFDSVLCRAPGVFNALRAVILDEIHLLDATPRGDQLRILCGRLRRLRPDLQFAALSATLSTPAVTAARYFPDFQCVAVEGGREIEFTLLSNEDLPFLRGEFMKKGIRKAIFFCNSRKETELVSQILRQRAILPPARVYTHHGSLSRAERESVEEAMRVERTAFCVATMTLEFGIDIGDVDAICLYGAPDSVSSLLQRIGRGNRRTGRSVIYGIHREPLDREAMVSLLEDAIAGRIETKRYVPFLSVAVQQTFSMVYGARARGLPAGELEKVLVEADMPLEEVREIVDHLVDEGYLVRRSGRLAPADRLMDMAERGTIHSNIEDMRLWEVVDQATMRVIGDAPVGREAGGRLIPVGGRVWEIVRHAPGERRLYVRLTNQRMRPTSWPGRASLGRFQGLLPRKLQDRERARHSYPWDTKA